MKTRALLTAALLAAAQADARNPHLDRPVHLWVDAHTAYEAACGIGQAESGLVDPRCRCERSIRERKLHECDLATEDLREIERLAQRAARGIGSAFHAAQTLFLLLATTALLILGATGYFGTLPTRNIVGVLVMVVFVSLVSAFLGYLFDEEATTLEERVGTESTPGLAPHAL